MKHILNKNANKYKLEKTLKLYFIGLPRAGIGSSICGSDLEILHLN